MFPCLSFSFWGLGKSAVGDRLCQLRKSCTNHARALAIILCETYVTDGCRQTGTLIPLHPLLDENILLATKNYFVFAATAYYRNLYRVGTLNDTLI